MSTTPSAPLVIVARGSIQMAGYIEVWQKSSHPLTVDYEPIDTVSGIDVMRAISTSSAPQIILLPHGITWTISANGMADLIKRRNPNATVCAYSPDAQPTKTRKRGYIVDLGIVDAHIKVSDIASGLLGKAVNAYFEPETGGRDAFKAVIQAAQQGK